MTLSPNPPGYHVLAESELEAIHQASLEVLQTTGYHLPVKEARRLIEENGGNVSGERGYLTPQMVEQSLNSIRPFQLYDRLGNPSQALTPGRVAFSTIADTFYVQDPYSQKVRPFMKADQAWLARVIDALPNLDYVQVVGQAHDVPDRLQTQVAVAQTLRQTSKPLLVYPYDRRGLLDVLDLAAVVRGGQEELRGKPFLMCAAVPGSPLYGTDYSLGLLLTCAERRIPVLSYNCPAIGGSSPADVIGTLVLANADWLANLTLHQLKNPGAPFCTAGFTVQLMDMKTTLWSYCAPETLQAYSAAADLAHFYGFPSFGLEMTSDSSEIDAQMGVELELQCHRAFLSGVEMVHNAGIYGAGKLCGAEAVILADETIDYTRAACSPLQAGPESIAAAVGLIEELGPMGDYVSHDHTLKNFRKFWYPSLLDRSRFDPQGERSVPELFNRLNQRARELIESHVPVPLTEEVASEIQLLETDWYARA